MGPTTSWGHPTTTVGADALGCCPCARRSWKSLGASPRSCQRPAAGQPREACRLLGDPPLNLMVAASRVGRPHPTQLTKPPPKAHARVLRLFPAQCRRALPRSRPSSSAPAVIRPGGRPRTPSLTTSKALTIRTDLPPVVVPVLMKELGLCSCNLDQRARVLSRDEQERPSGARRCSPALLPLLQRADRDPEQLSESRVARAQSLPGRSRPTALW